MNTTPHSNPIRGIRAVRANVSPAQALAELTAAWSAFRKENDEAVGQIRADLDAVAAAMQRPGLTGHPGSNPASAEQTKAFYAWARTGNLEAKASLRYSSDPDGGFLVPEHLSRELDRVAGDELAMRRLANIVRIDEGDYKRPMSRGGAAAGWVGESDDRDATETPELALFAPAWSEIYAMPQTPQKLLDLAGFDVAGWLTDEIVTAELEMEGAAFIRGNGVGRPKGILSYDTVNNASYTQGKVGFVASGHASLFNEPDKLLDLQHALKPRYRRNGKWLMNDTTWAHIRKFKDAEGNYLWRAGLEPDAPDLLLGKPVEIDDNMDDIGAGKYPIAFGDFQRAYTIVEHTAGRRLIRDDLTRKGWVKFYTAKLIAGGVYNHEAIKLLKVAA